MGYTAAALAVPVGRRQAEGWVAPRLEMRPRTLDGLEGLPSVVGTSGSTGDEQSSHSREHYMAVV